MLWNAAYGARAWNVSDLLQKLKISHQMTRNTNSGKYFSNSSDCLPKRATECSQHYTDFGLEYFAPHQKLGFPYQNISNKSKTILPKFRVQSLGFLDFHRQCCRTGAVPNSNIVFGEGHWGALQLGGTAFGGHCTRMPLRGYGPVLDAETATARHTWHSALNVYTLQF